MNFLATTITYLTPLIHNHAIQQLVLSFLILVAALLLRSVLTRFFLNYLHVIAKKQNFPLNKKIIETLKPAIRLIPIAIALYVISIYLPFFAKISSSLIVISIFWSLYICVGPIGITVIKRKEEHVHKSLFLWALRVLKIIIVFFGTATILEVWGINVGAVLAGVGIVGAAVALATQDLFRNLIAGLLILSERRFSEGEWVRVVNVVEGIIENIGFRSTLIRRFDKAPVHVPNRELADSPLINFTRMTYRRIYWNIGLEYRTTTKQLKDVVSGIKTLLQGGDFADPPSAQKFVFVNAFDDSAINIMIYCFTKTTDWGEWLKVKENLALNIKELVETTGAGFAFPSQSIYVEKSGDFPFPNNIQSTKSVSP